MKYLGTLVTMFIGSIAFAGQPAAYAGGCRGYAIGYAAPQIQFAPITQYRPITTYQSVTETRPVIHYEQVTRQIPVTQYEPYTVNVPIQQCAPTLAYAPERERLIDRFRSSSSRTTINIDRERIRERSSLFQRERRGGCGSYGIEASTIEPPVLIAPIP